MATIGERAAEAHGRIKANVDAWYEDRITHAQFSENQRALWDEIAKDAELHEAVSARMLGELRAARAAA